MQHSPVILSELSCDTNSHWPDTYACLMIAASPFTFQLSSFSNNYTSHLHGTYLVISHMCWSSLIYPHNTSCICLSVHFFFYLYLASVIQYWEYTDLSSEYLKLDFFSPQLSWQPKDTDWTEMTGELYSEAYTKFVNLAGQIEVLITSNVLRCLYVASFFFPQLTFWCDLFFFIILR